MSRKRNEAVFLAFLLAGCVGAILFVYVTLIGPGRAFDMRESTTAPAPRAESPRLAPPPIEVEPAVEVPAAAEPDPEPEHMAPPVERDEPEATEPEATDELAQESAELTLELVEPATEEDRKIVVAVKDQLGERIPGALVVFRQGSLLVFRDRSDNAGEAEFEPFPEEKGPFRVDAIARGYSAGTSEIVAPGADTEITLKARPVVEGEVSAPSRGHGIVRLFTETGEKKTAIAPDGTFRFEELNPGQVTVQAEVDPYGAASEAFYLHDGTSRYVKLRVRDRGRTRIYGKLTIWPGTGSATINGVSVGVSRRGTYTFDKAVIGINEIVVDAPGRAPLRERFHVRSLQKSQYNFRLGDEATVRGRVRNARTRRPIPGATVRLGFDRGNPRNDRVPRFPVDRVPLAHTDNKGAFEVGRLDKRLIYLVSVVAPGYGQFIGEAVPDGGHLTVLLPEGPFVFGRLRGLGGLPKDAVVTATPLNPDYSEGRIFNVPEWDGARSGRDREGFYGLSGLLPGSYLVRVGAPNFGSIETIVDLAEGQRRRIDLRLRRGVFAEDDDEAELLSRLPPVIAAGGEGGAAGEDVTVLRVNALRPVHEEPFPGVKILFFDGEEEFTAPMEFFELEFDVVGLPEATYRAVLTHPLLRKPLVRDGIVLRRGKPFTIEFK